MRQVAQKVDAGERPWEAATKKRQALIRDAWGKIADQYDAEGGEGRALALSITRFVSEMPAVETERQAIRKIVEATAKNAVERRGAGAGRQRAGSMKGCTAGGGDRSPKGTGAPRRTAVTFCYTQAIGAVMNAVFDKTKPLRITVNLIQEAQLEGKVTGRTPGSQLEHWARIGRAVERSLGMTVALQRQALEYGTVDPEELTDNVRVIAALRGECGLDDFSEAERDLFTELLGLLSVSPPLARGKHRHSA